MSNTQGASSLGDRLAGRVAIVTGGATGIGRAVATLYAAEGASVVIGDLREDQGEATVAAIRAEGGKASFQRTDVRHEDQVAALVDAAQTRYGALHIATANAGILGSASYKDISLVTDEEFALVMDVNVGGVFRTFKHALPAIRAAGGGAMTATASIVGHEGVSEIQAYSASKGAVLALMRSMAVDAAPEVRVNAVSPGAVESEFDDHRREEGGAPRERSAASLARHRATPEEIARIHLFLVSDESSFVFGESIIANGSRKPL